MVDIMSDCCLYVPEKAMAEARRAIQHLPIFEVVGFVEKTYYYR